MRRRFLIMGFYGKPWRKERRRMQSFISKFRGTIKAVLSGFDRIVFKGNILPLVHDEGAVSFLRSKEVLNKNFKRWAIEQSAAITSRAEDYARRQSGSGIEPIANRQPSVAFVSRPWFDSQDSEPQPLPSHAQGPAIIHRAVRRPGR
ncbi:MAG TPA: hypothetical protein VLA51_06030 [Paracoccaceae bacterium]|nr:hypothetical protein [Paracoccaceae bacterium]